MTSKTCIGCNKSAPTSASVTLHAIGWRLIVEPSAPETLSRWRCPACWAAFKMMTGMPSLPPPPSSRSRTNSARKGRFTP
jgi:hypothetical protein